MRYIMEELKSKNKDIFTVRLDRLLYDRMMQKLRIGRKNHSINKYINNLIAKDLDGDKSNDTTNAD